MTDPQEPTRRMPPVPPQGAPTPPSSQPPPSYAAPPARRQDRWTLEAGRFWAGAAATAAVAALVGVVGTIVFEQILSIDLVVQDVFGIGSHVGAYVVGGIAASLVAAGLLHLLVASTPRPRAFFGWIVGLLTVVAALLPLTWTSDLTSALSTGGVNLLVGIAIWSLLSGVLGWTMHRAPGAA
jgi:hypothetical protein